MAKTYSVELTGVIDGTVPPARADGRVVGSKLRRTRATINLASQASGDQIVICRLPKGASFVSVRLTTDTSLGSAQVAVGNSTSNAKYKAAGTFTATDTPTIFGKTSGKSQAPLAAEEDVLITISAAALPSSGQLVAEVEFTISA